jgi:hypothetical protein
MVDRGAIYAPVSVIDVGGESGESFLVRGQQTKTNSLPFCLASDQVGSAGTPSAQVLTIQGVTSGTAVIVSQATAANLNATVVGTGTFAVQAAQSGNWNIVNISGTVSLPTNAAQETGGNLATLAGAVTASVVQHNTKQINGVAPSMGNGISGTGVQRVTIASDSTGTSIVTQATAANLNATVVGTGTFLVQAAQSGNWNVRNQDGSGNAINSTNNAMNVSLLADATPGSINITAADVGTTTTVGLNSQNAYTGSPTANSAATFAISSVDTVNIQITGSFNATLVTDVSFDGGTTFFTRGIHQAGTNYTAASFAGTGGTQGNAAGNMNTAGVTHVRVRATAYTSGTATVLITKSLQASAFYLVNSAKISDATVPTQQLAINSGGAASVAQAATTGGGASMYTLNSTASNNSSQVKASAGNIYHIIAINTTATIYYLKIFDGAPSMGSTNANWNIPIPANTSAAGVVIPLPMPISCASTINIALTGGIALNDNTSAATGVAVNIAYK